MFELQPQLDQAGDSDREDEQASWFTDLNPEQQAAVRHSGGPLLILAGAGTGKTTTLAGGLPVIADGHVAGAIGVAGAMTGAEDRRVAEAAVAQAMP